MVGEDRLRVFNDVEVSLPFIDSQHDTNIFLIISGTLGKVFAPRIATKPQIVGLYVYCIDENKHATWTKTMQKVRCTVSNTTKLFQRLHADIRQVNGRWPLSEQSFQKSSTLTSEWYHLFLLAISYQPQCIEKSYREMFDECRAYYKGNSSVLGRIESFALTYDSSEAIREYTRDGFLYRIVNRALRTQNMKIIKKFSPFITDLHYQLHKYHREYYLSNNHFIRAVYRGQLLSVDELEYFRSVCKSRNPMIKLTTFCSASLNPEVALSFALPLEDRIPCLFEIIITNEYDMEQSRAIDYRQAFADVSSLSFMPHEREVLFSLLTHFRIKYVSDPISHPDHPWVLIVLELDTDKERESEYSHFNIIKCIEKEKGPQNYAGILSLFQANAEEEVRFDKMNWKKWWSNLSKHWGTDKEREQPLLLIFYQCFTMNQHWSRKAVEMYKEILHSHSDIQSLQSLFPHLFDRYKTFQVTPAKWIALYEDYLKQFCITNTKKVIDCLYFAGETYEMISDKECALECYRQAIALNLHDEHRMNVKIQDRLRKLNKSPKTNSPMKNDRGIGINDTDKDFQRMYRAQEEQWSAFWEVRRKAAQNPSKLIHLLALREYLIRREEWYDAADLKIILRLPDKNTQNLSIDDYQSYFLPAVKRHMLSTTATIDGVNHRSLALWRYRKYMSEWMQLTELERFLRPLQANLGYTITVILPQLEQLIRKITLLITVCTAYICIEAGTDKINMDHIQFINVTSKHVEQLAFFDLGDNDLLLGLKALRVETPSRAVSPITTSDPFDYLDLS